MSARKTLLLAGCAAAAAAAASVAWNRPSPVADVTPTAKAANSADAAAPRRAPAQAPARALAATAGNAAAGEAPAYQTSRIVQLPMNGDVPYSVAVGDVTGDGRDDLVVATSHAYNETPHGSGYSVVIVYERQSDGGLRETKRLPLTPYSWNNYEVAPGLTVSDMDNDGIADIVVGYRVGVIVHSSDGAGGFRSFGYRFADGQGHRRLAVGDFNDDGFQDVVASSPHNGNGGFIFFGSGGKDTLWTSQRLFEEESNFQVVDATGDGIADIVVADRGTPGLKVLAGSGRYGDVPLFAYSATDSAYTGTWTTGLGVGDFDDDGLIDFAVPAMTSTAGGRLWVFGGRGNAAPRLPARLERSWNVPKAVFTTDLNRDGRDDLVVLHPDYLGYYVQAQPGPNSTDPAVGLQTEWLNSIDARVSDSQHAVSAGDLDGDGCTDIAAASTTKVWIYYGSGCRAAPQTAPQRPRHDIDGDGRGDLLWRGPGDNHWAYWTMDGAQRRDGLALAVGPDWKMLASGDFDGDHRLDAIWSDGRSMQLWRGDGVRFTGLPMRDYPAGYRLIASGDVDGDGKADLVWRDDSGSVVAVWTMDGARVSGGRALVIGSRWQLLGSGDFDGDSRLDLLWGDGLRMRQWRFGPKLRFVQAPMADYPAGWTLAGVADANGDGRSDLFWRHAGAGQFAIWQLRGAQRIASAGYAVGGAWRVVGIDDYSGDGRADVIWSDGTSMQMWRATDGGYVGDAMAGYPAGWNALAQ
ncbi:FG-GAP repeat domain-containing protein [Lysobacter enzymogenes]|uniref:Repeat domain-containing protein n=1 Tax=Lysobacter enzymogenes TaxID=69 RepID=A0AAU9ACU1_LYSEN|nr:VCBS repeat-containing protein [Lysobacter enzymogenes]BAV95972.1 hypothetical protein LEN_0485 [Lysobacter enzymogenes]